MNELTTIALAVSAVFAGAICGIKLTDALFTGVRSIDLIIAAAMGAVAFAAGSAALHMVARAIAGAA